jgi:hypothetical protein
VETLSTPVGQDITQEHIWNFSPAKQLGGQGKGVWNLRANKTHPTFQWQKPTYPFGFPIVSEPNEEGGDVVISYPPNMTKLLRIPMSKKQCLAEGVLYIPEAKRTRHERRALCTRLQSQSW